MSLQDRTGAFRLHPSLFSSPGDRPCWGSSGGKLVARAFPYQAPEQCLLSAQKLPVRLARMAA